MKYGKNSNKVLNPQSCSNKQNRTFIYYLTHKNSIRPSKISPSQSINLTNDYYNLSAYPLFLSVQPMPHSHTRQSSQSQASQTHQRESQFQQYDIAEFKAKYVFKPFEYQDKLEQTLAHTIDALNVKVSISSNNTNNAPQHSHNNLMDIDHQPHSVRSSNVRFGMDSNCESFNSTSKSIKTNKSIIHPDLSPTIQLKTTQPTQKSPFYRPTNLMKKTISFTTGKRQSIPQTQTTNMVQIDQKVNRPLKKSSMNKKKYQQEQKEQGFFYEKNQFSSFKTSENNIKNGSTSFKNNLSSIPQNQGSMCQSIALGSQLVQNFIKSTLENPLANNHSLSTNPTTKNPSMTPQSLNFYQFCMLLFPETPKSLPCSILIMDTLFYLNSPETKEIIYVFKDKRRNILMKMRNKNKSAYELFMKRRVQYETTKAREQKLRRTGRYDERERMLVNGSRQNWAGCSNTKGKWKADGQKSTCAKEVKFKTNESFTHANSCCTGNQKMKSVGCNKEYEASVKCLEDSNFEEAYGFQNNQRYSIVEQDELASSRPVIKGTMKEINVTGKAQGSGNVQDLHKHLESQEASQQRDSEQSSFSGLSYMSYHNGVNDGVGKKMTKMPIKGIDKNLRREHQSSNIKSPKDKSNEANCYVPKSPSKQQSTKQLTTPSRTPTQQASTFSQSPRLTPSNSIRQSIHTLQTNYLAILKYLNNQTIRLKQQQFKAIFHNPLYANERFKNNNNTQYIQALPIEDEFRDLKVYSIHFHYELFKDQPLFVYVRDSLFRENEYMTVGKGNMCEEKDETNMFGSVRHSVKSRTAVFDARSPQNIKNEQLKQRIRQESVEVYLHYQIFEMYTYASMHYNKQILNGIFRFIEYDNQYALFQTQNLIAKNLPTQGQFIKAKIFPQQTGDDDLTTDQLMAKFKLKAKQYITPSTSNCATHQALTTAVVSATDTPSQTMKKINKEMLKLNIEDYGSNEQTDLQRQLLGYFSQQNTKIQQEMSSYFTEKIEKIKNVKDSHLSKCIFKIINDLPVSPEKSENDENKSGTRKKQGSLGMKKPGQSSNAVPSRQISAQFQGIDFHSILNDQKNLQRFLRQKQQNDPYARKNISNYSVVRWKQEIKKVKQGKCQNMAGQANMSVEQGKTSENQKDQSKSTRKQVTRPMTACSLVKGKRAEQGVKFRRLNRNPTTDPALMKFTLVSSSSQKQNISSLYNQQSTKQPNFLSTYASTNPFRRLNNSSSSKLDCTSASNFGLSENQARRFEKKLINEKYTHVNKAKFTFNSFKTDKFF